MIVGYNQKNNWLKGYEIKLLYNFITSKVQ